MHILIMIAGILAGGAFWWYRMKDVGNAASEVVDQAGRVRGHFRRKGMQKKANLSPLTAIDDPVVAAATVMMAIAAEDRIGQDNIVQLVTDQISPIAQDDEKTVEAVTYAKWAIGQIDDVPTVIDHTARFLSARLSGDEKEQLVAMVNAAAPAAGRHTAYNHRIDRLRRKLGLTGTL